MNERLLEIFKKITIEEKIILKGKKKIRKEIYTSQKKFIIESKKFLKNRQLVEMRRHTRFTHFPKHSHNYIEMVYMCKGHTTHIINREKIFLKEGEILILNQNAIQEIFPAGKEDIAINFIILPEVFDDFFSVIGGENKIHDFLISSLSKEYKDVSYLHFQTHGMIIIQNIIENIIWMILEKKFKNNLIIKNYMEILFLTLLGNSEIIKSDESVYEKYEKNLVSSILNYIDTYYKDGTLKELVSIIGQKAYFISRILKKYTNCNFKELIQRKKLERAAYLLLETELPIEKILSAIGYRNSSFFYRKFKEKYKVSPKNYRKNNFRK
jgi:hypothetical protein